MSIIADDAHNFNFNGSIMAGTVGNVEHVLPSGDQLVQHMLCVCM